MYHAMSSFSICKGSNSLTIFRWYRVWQRPETGMPSGRIDIKGNTSQWNPQWSPDIQAPYCSQSRPARPSYSTSNTIAAELFQLCWQQRVKNKTSYLANGYSSFNSQNRKTPQRERLSEWRHHDEGKCKPPRPNIQCLPTTMFQSAWPALGMVKCIK